MRRIRLTSIGVLTGGLILAVGTVAGVAPADAAPSPSDLQTTVPAVQNAAGAAVAQATGSATPTSPGPASDPLPSLPASVAAPISALSNEIGGTLLPGQDSTTGSNTTGQSSPVANADAPINACSLSVGVVADSGSGCSTTSVGLNQAGGVADVNAPITAQDNAIGLLNLAASAFGLASGQSASTSQDGAINADAPVSICSVNVGLVANTSSDCDTAGTSGPATQTGTVDAEVPVTVCDVIAEIDGDSSADCPQQSTPTSQQGQAADVFVPVTACGAVVEVDGSSNGMCMPDAGFPLVNDLPTDDGNQSAPVDGVIPVDACSVVVAVAGTANNSCEPTHVSTSSTGSVPVFAPVTVCAVSAALQGTATGTCTGSGTGSSTTSGGTPGSTGTGATAPVTLCGVQAALEGTANASCPEPVTSPSTSSPTSGTGTPPVSASSGATPVPATLAANPGPVERANGGHGRIGRFVPGVHGRSAGTRGGDRSRVAAGRPIDQPLRPSPSRPKRSRRVGAKSEAFATAPGPTRRGTKSMDGGGMFKNQHDAGDVSGLEEVFRSQERSRSSEAAGHEPEGALRLTRHALSIDAIEANDRAAAPTELPVGDDTRSGTWPRPGDAPPGSADSPLRPGPLLEPDKAGGGAGLGERRATASAGAPRRRESTRYWTMAALSALVALVVAGVTSGTGQHRAPSTSAQMKQGPTRPQSGFHTPGAAAMGPTGPGSLNGEVGSGAPLSGLSSVATGRTGEAPGGHVTLIGAATTTGAAASSTTGGSPSGGTTGTPPPSGGSNPVTPVAASVGSTVGSVGASVTSLANQVASEVPAVAPATNVASNAVGTVDEAATRGGALTTARCRQVAR